MPLDTLTNVPLVQMTRTFNEAFADYVVPASITEEGLAEKLHADDVDLSLSIGAFESDQLVGFLFHGVRDIDGVTNYYNAATGVVPLQRGQGLAGRMYTFFRDHLATPKPYRLVLEVITSNEPAIRAYEKEGFARIRELLCFSGNVKKAPVPDGIVVEQLRAPDWPTFEEFWDVEPSWQFAPRSVDRTDGRIIFGAYVDHELAGFSVLSPRRRIMQLAVAEAHRHKGVGSALLQMMQYGSDDPLGFINVDEQAVSLRELLVKNGLEETLRQHEMAVTETD